MRRLWVAETLEAFALVAFVAGTVLHLRDRRMRLEHGPHSACSLEDAVTAWAQRTGIIAYGVLVLPLLKCVAAAYRMEAGAKRQEPWARLFLSQSRRQVSKGTVGEALPQPVVTSGE